MEIHGKASQLFALLQMHRIPPKPALSHRALSSRAAVAVALIGLLCGTLRGQDSGTESWVKVVESARPAVVMIQTEVGQGSGFLVKTDGTLVTNDHVIAGANEILITLASGDVYRRAHLIASDASRDLAILRIEAMDVPTLPLGNSNDCKVGEGVILFGNPHGLEQTVSSGLISGIRLSEGGTRTIQTTAPASPGSSGGPLLNGRGEAIGVMSFSVVEGQNLNFALAINYVRGMLEILKLSSSSTPFRILDSSDPMKSTLRNPKSRKRSGVVLAGYGRPADSFQFIYLEIMNFLATNGVVLANKRTDFKPVTGDSVSLHNLFEGVRQSGADGLLYMTLDSGWNQVDRLKLQCFDANGKLLWEKKTRSTWAMSLGGAARTLSKNMKRKLRNQIGRPGLPVENTASEHETEKKIVSR